MSAKACTLPPDWRREVIDKRLPEGERLLLILLWRTCEPPKRLPVREAAR